MLALHSAGIRTEVIPGITAASGCSSYAGIPLTQRNESQGCTFITGHAEKELSHNWANLAQLDHTLIFYMDLSQLSIITQQLTQHGLAASTPATLIEKGTHRSQSLQQRYKSLILRLNNINLLHHHLLSSEK